MNLKKPQNTALETGKLLIAEPMLNDPNFARSVVLLCEHNDEGSIGFALNRPTDINLTELLPELPTLELNVNQGGPVQLNTLHMLHRVPQYLGGNHVANGAYWGGSYEALQDVLREGVYDPKDVKLFIGYSGWSPGQLEKEIEEGSWIITDLKPQILFDTDAGSIWRQAVVQLGKEYAYLANMPIHPQLN